MLHEKAMTPAVAGHAHMGLLGPSRHVGKGHACELSVTDNSLCGSLSSMFAGSKASHVQPVSFAHIPSCSLPQ